MINLLNSSWDNTSLLVVISETKHCECLTSTCLPVAHDSSIVASNYALNDTRSSLVIDIVLSGVMQDGIELEFPVVKLIVHRTHVGFVAVDSEFP